jgi:phosphatidylserine decarboxylase
MVRLIYETGVGQWMADRVLSHRAISRVYGGYQSSALSRRKIAPFVQKFAIAMDEFEPGPFASFNDFFIRKFRKGARHFLEEPSAMPAFAEARYLAFNAIQSDQTFPVKGKFLSAEALLGSAELAQSFMGGPLLLARLCPTDYHRFHFPDSGQILRSYTLHGKLHSVSPIALRYKENIFATNERQITLLKTDHFGTLAYIEVGALCVGKIVQTTKSEKFQRGDEKGYFLFGASTVIVMGEPGAWMPDADLLEQTACKRETLVQLGEKVALR